MITDALKTYGPQESVLRQAERFLLTAGITPEQITAFRKIMLGSDAVPNGSLLQKNTSA